MQRAAAAWHARGPAASEALIRDLHAADIADLLEQIGLSLQAIMVQARQARDAKILLSSRIRIHVIQVGIVAFNHESRTLVPLTPPSQSDVLYKAIVADGSDRLGTDVYKARLRSGDALLLCTDGLNKHVSDEAIARAVGRLAESVDLLIIAGQKPHIDYNLIPGVVYTWPELASVGKSEEELKEAGRKYRAGRYYFKANGRAKTMGEEDGFVKILADADTDALLGVHIVGPNASDLIAEIVVAVEMQASAEDVARMKRIYNERRIYMIRRLKEMGFGITVEPTGAFYVFANARHISGDSYKLAFDILEKAHVGVSPGIDFGENGEGYLRFSYANSLDNLRKALERITTCVETFSG